MATKPNETYKWGENATHEQVAAYEDTGWPDDMIPPKRTQFNWYQNLVGKWLGWAEDAVGELVETVLDRWFTIVYGDLYWHQSIPNENGLYEFRLGVPALHTVRWLVAVTNGTAIAVQLREGDRTAPTHLELDFGVWDDNSDSWTSKYEFTRANTRNVILGGSSTEYVTPKGLVDYFSVKGNVVQEFGDIPNSAGIYTIGLPSVFIWGFAIVTDDRMFFVSVTQNPDYTANRWYEWESGAWVRKS